MHVFIPGKRWEKSAKAISSIRQECVFLIFHRCSATLWDKYSSLDDVQNLHIHYQSDKNDEEKPNNDREIHSFKYSPELTPDIVLMLTELHEYEGYQKSLSNVHKDELRALESVEKIQSIGASNRIEGIFTSDKRLREISEEKTAPENRSEQEIAGYREVLN